MSDFVEVKTSELTGTALDWAVAMTEGWEADRPQDGQIRKGYIYMRVGPFRLIGLGAEKFYSPSTNWAQGGPLRDKYKVAVFDTNSYGVVAVFDQSDDWFDLEAGNADTIAPTALIAICRAIVATKLGDAILVPVELVDNSVNDDNT